MNEPSNSPPPRRLLGLALVGLALCSLYLTGSATAGWPVHTRRWLLLGLSAIFLILHGLLAPAALSYALILDLRRWSRQRIESLGKGGRRLAHLIEKARWVDLTIPFVLTLLLFASAWLALEAVAGPVGASRGVPLVPFWATTLVVLLGLPLVVLLPGRLANRGSERPGRWSDLLAQAAVEAFRPMLVPLVWMADRAWRRLEGETDSLGLPEDDLADAIEVGSHQGDLSIVQSELLRREIDFSRLTAADVMVPRVKVQYLDVAMDFDEARRRVLESHYSRFPVQRGTVDNIIAIVHVKTILKYLLGEPPSSVRRLLFTEAPRPPLHLRMDQPLNDVLAALRRERVSLAVVDDPYGGVAGILTVEDVVEELVGEIVDESDQEPVVEVWSCSGRRTLRELAEHSIGLPGDPDTPVAAFLAAQLGDGPYEAQSWASGGVRLVVEEVDADGRIETVRTERRLYREPRGRTA
ncbi:MAG: CBS domain-containing protein [Armatimonadetes bacterium]|nr:CBS domain-containing protein [Armatimonadota bacterium]